MQICIPLINQPFRIAESIDVEVEWSDDNLVFLREHGLTGTKIESSGRRVVRDENNQVVYDEEGQPVFINNFYNKTIPNPLYERHDGSYNPAGVTLSEQYSLMVVKYKPTATNPFCGLANMKVIDSPNKPEIGCILQLRFDVFKTLEIDFI